MYFKVYVTDNNIIITDNVAMCAKTHQNRPVLLCLKKILIRHLVTVTYTDLKTACGFFVTPYVIVGSNLE